MAENREITHWPKVFSKTKSLGRIKEFFEFEHAVMTRKNTEMQGIG
jgi:hypothetical protein